MAQSNPDRMPDDEEETTSSEKPAMDAPQEEFIQQQAVPSQPQDFGAKKREQSDTAEREKK